MAVQIGQEPQQGFTEPLGLLTDCHRRIERFLAVLVRLADEVQGAPLTTGYEQALSTALRYFRNAAPKHTEDEEESLFPRLRTVGGAEVEAALSEVERLEADHVRAARLHREVDELGSAWLRNGSLPDAAAERFRALSSKLREIYSAHIEVEDKLIFPLAARVLPEDARQAIGREMAARRNVITDPI